MANDFGNEMRVKMLDFKEKYIAEKAIEFEVEKTKKKSKKPAMSEEFDPQNVILNISEVKVKYSDDILNEMLLYKLNTKICLMKGFILDGIPKNLENA